MRGQQFAAESLCRSINKVLCAWDVAGNDWSRQLYGKELFTWRSGDGRRLDPDAQRRVRSERDLINACQQTSTGVSKRSRRALQGPR